MTTASSIDDEWTKYITESTTTSRTTTQKSTDIISPTVEQVDDTDYDDIEALLERETVEKAKDAKPYQLYISTKTKVLFLNQAIDIQSVFWEIPVTEYWRAQPGIMKKQIKIVSKTVEEFEQYKKRLLAVPFYNEIIIKQIDNPTARSIKFKDERKITIGVSKKDIMNCRIRNKNAFYNCFAMIMRFLYDDEYREIHVKVFNTGKMEIPGILNNRLLEIVKVMILEILTPHLPTPVAFVENRKCDSVLINSNFNCGYYIRREKLYSILRTKYNIETSYDPCSYPGVKSKFYFNNDGKFVHRDQTGSVINGDPKMTMSELMDNKKYTEVSFMVFRTGSCLIVGNCSEQILMYIFRFIRRILIEEESQISMVVDEAPEKMKKLKIRKKTVIMTAQYYEANIGTK